MKIEGVLNDYKDKTVLNNKDRFFKEKKILKKILGPVLAVILLIIFQVFYSTKMMVPDIIGIFAAIIVYSILAGGLKSGFISCSVSIMYLFDRILIVASIPAHSKMYLMFKFFNSLTLIGAALLIGNIMLKLKGTNEELHKNKMCLARAEELSPIMIVHGSMDGKILKVPLSFCKLLGYSKEELLSMNFCDITYPDDFEKGKELIKGIFDKSYHSTDIEKRYIKKNGQTIWVYVNISLVSDEYGVPLYLLGYVKDVTKRKNAEKALGESEKRLRQITDNMLDVIYQVNNQGEIEYISPSCRSILGYNENELIGKSIFDFVHPDDLERVKYICNLAIKIGMDDIVEYRYRHKNGHYLWIESMGKPVFNEQGELIGGVISDRDITERKCAEEALKESEERYRLLVEHSPYGISVHQNGRIIFVNKAAAEMGGFKDAKELIGKDVMDFVHPACQKKVLNRIKLTNERKGNLPFIEEKFIKVDGTVIDVEVAVIFYKYKGEPASQVIFHDITDRKRAERNERLLREAKEYDKLKNEFFANISHELRTPLNVILGTLQLMKLYLQDGLNGSQKPVKYVNIMRQNCNRLLRLVNNLIDITRIDAGFFEIKLQNVDIVNLIEEITLSVADYIENKGITLQFDTDIEEKMIACDPDKIERIMLNLLSNGIKFTDADGSIKVTIYNGETSIRISIKDTGIGIPKEQCERIFERFRQVDKSLARNHEGSGIGLSLVKSLVELHNGKIYIESEYGVGSEFIIELPVRILPQQNNQFENTHPIQWGCIERIQIEFSDIYS